MKKLKQILLVISIFALFVPQVSFALEDFEKTDEFLISVKEYILKHYDGEVSEEELIQGAIDGMFEETDRFSIYLEAPESKEFENEVEGKLFGIGATISLRDGQAHILELLEDSPAGKAGVLPGDIIIEIDGERLGFLDYLNDAIDKIKGAKGTPVRMKVVRGGQILDFEIIRGEIKINPVRYKVIDEKQKIGYLKISEFNANVIENTHEAVDELVSKGTKKLVLDLRGNPGGGLSEVVKVAQDFVPEGDLVSVVYKNGKNLKITTKEKVKFNQIAVLINENSASASEILAGAIQDREAGVLIGQKSYGKGTVQNVLKLKNGDSIKLTIGRYYLPSGRTIDHTGLVPDYEIPRFNEKLDLENMLKLDVQREIESGDSGVNVVALQQRLNLMGYGVEITGMFDNQTATALGILQSGYGIERDEVGDIQTLRKVNQKFSEYLLAENNDMQLKKAIEILSE